MDLYIYLLSDIIVDSITTIFHRRFHSITDVCPPPEPFYLLLVHLGIAEHEVVIKLAASNDHVTVLFSHSSIKTEYQQSNSEKITCEFHQTCVKAVQQMSLILRIPFLGPPTSEVDNVYL